MKLIRIAIMIVMAMLPPANVNAQELETKVTQGFTIRDVNWNKVLNYGDPVTIFAYEQNSDTHSFGIYSDDYAGIIHTKTIPFDVEPKQLKKLPKSAKKKLSAYTVQACEKARDKALAGKYRTITTDMLLSNQSGVGTSRNEPITIFGYKAERSYGGSYTYYYAIAKKDATGICYSYDLDKVTINDVPLPFLPSISDPQVQTVLKKEKQIILEREAAENRARQEEERRLAEQRRADEQLWREQEHKYLRLMDPAYIEVKKMNMDNAGGVDVSIKFTNCSSSRVKYVYFTGYFLNAVGDKCRNEIDGSTVWKYTGVGPVSRIPDTPDNNGSHIKFFHSDPPFYSKTARKFILSSVTIEYMNGKKVALTGGELEDRVDYAY